jgi:hypothetical protein
VKRLELAKIRVCDRCGRGGAELRGEEGEVIVVPLDPVRARQLRTSDTDDVRPLTDLVLAELRANGCEPREVVIDVLAGRLRALLSVVRAAENDVVECTAEEGVALAVRGNLRLYATDEAVAHATARAAKKEKHGGTGGPETLH